MPYQYLINIFLPVKSSTVLLLTTKMSRHILNDTSNVTDRMFAIFSKLCKTLNLKFQGSAKKNIYMRRVLEAKLCE